MTPVTTPALHARVAAIDLEAIASLSDPIGVLSVYVDADPALLVGPRPAWQTGRGRDLSRDAFELAEPPKRQPRHATNPAVPQSFPERDRFASALGARVAARLREAGARLARQSQARGWDTVVVDGDPRLVEVLSDTLRSGALRLVPSSRRIAGLPDAAAAGRVGAIVREERSKGDAELLRKLHASPASTGDPLVLERSLDEGRVEHLLISAPEQPSQAAIRESLLRRALETGAEVTVFAPGARELAASGAAALLRW
jgi:hypothetical protein